MMVNGDKYTHLAKTNRLKGPVITFVVMTIMNVLLWTGANFEGFHPPAQGSWKNRLLAMAITESGPFGSFWPFWWGPRYVKFDIIDDVIFLALSGLT
jgi:hypothetical protein